MKNKKLIYLMMFAFSFILPSFSFIPEKEADNRIVQTTSDSVTVSIEFSNPKLTITDDRQSLDKNYNLQQSTNKELIDVVKELNRTFAKVSILQEKRDAPILAQLEQKTGYSVGQINRFILIDNTIDKGYFVITIVFIIAILIIYVTSYRRLREVVFAPILISVLVYISVLFVWQTLVPLGVGKDYFIFLKLLELSPI